MPKITVAGGVMILVNIGFLVGGLLLMRHKSTFETSGWADTLKGTDYESVAHTVTMLLQALGYATIALALMGIVGAIIHNRLLLLLYSIVMFIAMSAFAVLAATAFTFNSKMSDWKKAPFPADDQESIVGKRFNEVYCYAEGYYYCNLATTEDVHKTFFPNVMPQLVSMLPNVTGIISLCDKVGGMVAGLDTLCNACKKSSEYAKYEKILTWPEKQCPRTLVTINWCASFLATGNAGEVYKGSPYGQCRTIFLNVAINWSHTVAIGGLLVAITAAVIIVMACFSRRSKSADDDAKAAP